MRPILARERPLVDALFEFAGLPVPDTAAKVEEMNDGGMGSLAFAPRGRRLGGTLSECRFTDADGVLVFVALNLDEEGRPLEIDVWKVDFTPLKRWPRREDLSRFGSEGNEPRH